MKNKWFKRALVAGAALAVPVLGFAEGPIDDALAALTSGVTGVIAAAGLFAGVSISVLLFVKSRKYANKAG